MFRLKSLYFLLALLTFTFCLFTLPSNVSAQISTPGAEINYQTIDPTTITPQSPMYADLMVNNLLHAGACLMVGFSPSGQPCISYSNGNPVISSINNSGGLLGSVTNLTTTVIAYPPIRTGQYLATLRDSLGLVKETHAQVGGNGSGVLSPIMNLWQVSRNIAYVIMIMIFVVIGLMVMFRQRINPQTVISVQAALPGLVIGLIMITFSYFLSSLLTDTAYLGTNLVGYYFQAAQSSTSSATLVEQTKDKNALTIVGSLMNGIKQEDIAKGLSSFFDSLVDPAARLVRLAVGFGAYQFGSSVGPAIGASVAGIGCFTAVAVPFIPTTGPLGLLGALSSVPPCAAVGQVIGGITGGAIFGAKAIQDPAGVAGTAFWFVAMAIIIYQMGKLLIRLITNYLNIIFLTVAGPFYFLFSSLPGRQELGTTWIRNMLCNTLAFPGVMAVFYFINYLLGPVASSPFIIDKATTVTGTTALPLLGGMDLSFIKVLLAFGALVALPTIPDIICRAVGKVEQYGQIMSQEISGGMRQGQQYAGQAGEAPRRIAGDVSALGGLRDTRTREIITGENGSTSFGPERLSEGALRRAGKFFGH